MNKIINNQINDIRNEFKNITFSGYQKSKVRTVLIDAIYNEKIENSCYWVAELLCAGHYSELWDIIIYYMSKYIHIGNPKLPIYIYMRFTAFLNIMHNGYQNNILAMRNNEKIRRLFSECIIILCYSKKTHSFEFIKINNENEINIINMSEKLQADSTEFATKFLNKDDPKQLFIPLNEFIYNLDKKYNTKVCYWLEWILEYEKISIKNKLKLEGISRIYAPKEHQKDIIWIIWDILIIYSKELNNSLIIKIIDNLLQLFMIKYTKSTKQKRKYLIYFAISLLIENIDLSHDIVENKERLNLILKKIDNIYIQIKKNEIAPKTDYLFNGLERNNLEKTIEKLDIMNNLENFEDE